MDQFLQHGVISVPACPLPFQSVEDAAEYVNTFREDLDESRQFTTIDLHRRMTAQQAIANDWKQTCLSKKDHRHMVMMLFAESIRFRPNALSKAVKIEISDKLQALMSDKDDTDRYVEALQFLSKFGICQH